MIVTDASAVLELLLRSAAGHAVERLVAESDSYAPDLLDVEVFNRLVRAEKHHLLSSAEVDQRVGLLGDAVIVRLASRTLLPAARRFAVALSGYDALYVAAAAALRCPLLTCDHRLARAAASQFGVPVTHVPSSGR